MEWLAVFLTIVAVLGMAVHSLTRRKLLNKKETGGARFTEREVLIAQCGVASALAFLWLIAFGPWWNTLGTQSRNPTLWWIALAATTAANIVIQFAGARANRLAEASFVAPIAALTPGLVVASALLIGEVPSTLGFVGIGLIVVATYAHAREGARLREYFTPLFFWLAFRDLAGLPEEQRNRMRALRWAYGSALCATVGLMGDGLVARHGDMILAVALELGMLALVYAIVLRRTAKDEGHFTPFVERLRLHWRPLALMCGGFATPFIMLGVAFRLAPIAYVGSLKRLAIVLTVMGGVWLLRERAGGRRITLTVVITAGAMMLAFDPTPGVVLNSLEDYLRRLF